MLFKTKDINVTFKMKFKDNDFEEMSADNLEAIFREIEEKTNMEFVNWDYVR